MDYLDLTEQNQDKEILLISIYNFNMSSAWDSGQLELAGKAGTRMNTGKAGTSKFTF